MILKCVMSCKSSIIILNANLSPVGVPEWREGPTGPREKKGCTALLQGLTSAPHPGWMAMHDWRLHTMTLEGDRTVTERSRARALSLLRG